MRRRLLRHPLSPGTHPEVAFLALAAEGGDLTWLDSGPRGRHVLASGERILPVRGAVFSTLRAELAAELREVEEVGFTTGLVGWVGYEARGESTGSRVPPAAGEPESAFLRVDRALVIDLDAGTADLLALGTDWEGDLAAWRDRMLAALAAPPSRPAPPVAPGPVRWRVTRGEYLDQVAACLDAIREGEAYQLCLTTQAKVSGAVDPVATYLALRATSPTHHGGFLRIAGTSLLSASPERFVEVDADGLVRTRPIKGTRPRSADPVADGALAADLLASDKERAENVMIVDLMRNDLSRVCATGTVAVSSLLAVESYPAVHQLVSEVEGRLRPGLGAVDALEACFPAGSMTGAPKIRATQILDALEGAPRGIYSGAFGYLGFDGRADLAMVIRSIVVDEAGATVGAGGGITALSDPAAEYDEMLLKARAPLAALGVPLPDYAGRGPRAPE